jgi:hypothetical protein
MRIYRQTDELARKFDAAYPVELSARLQWWARTLGIDRVRLLRMIGLSAREAGERQGQDLKQILNSPDWEANAQLLEGGLHRLLSLFRYDWHALAERIHGPVGETEQGEPSRATHRKGEVKRLRDIPNGDASDLLINRLAEGGPESLSVLLAYLASSLAGAHRADS